MEDRKYSFVVCQTEDEQIVGTIGLTYVVRGPLQSCMIGYNLDQAANGKGYMTEAVKQVVRYAFEELRLHRIVGEASPNNPGSIRVLEGRLPQRRHLSQQCEDQRRLGGPPGSSYYQSVSGYLVHVRDIHMRQRTIIPL